MSWHRHAQCARPEHRGVDFYSDNAGAIELALAVCAACPVRTQCLDEELGRAPAEQWGVRGGMRPEDRARLVRRRRRGRTQMVPALGAIRRTRALGAAGYTDADLAARAGLARETVSRLRMGRPERVYRPVHEAIATAYRALAGHTPERPRRRWRTHRALDLGWAPPAAWEGADIDDPDARPAPVAV